MAAIPYFLLGPNTLLSIFGLAHDPDRTVPVTDEDWRKATVDVVIPAHNEECNIALCLASLHRQTLQPKRIILIDDGSNDRTMEYAKDYCSQNGINLIAIHRHESIGKTPTLKRQSREFDSDVEFILDGDTILESPNYIERAIEELYKGHGIASACGTILPMRDIDRRTLGESESVRSFLAAHPDASILLRESPLRHFQRQITTTYREILYFYLQKFIYHGQMVYLGGTIHPVGCAVAYRRKVLKNLIFDHYEPILGDDLTNSEDIFIGFAIDNLGLRNIQLSDVYARSEEPAASAVPHQIYLWSSSFFQSCYYFDALMRTPFKAFRHFLYERQQHAQSTNDHPDRRHAAEAYRQPFGEEFTLNYGRPVGWAIFTSALEKIAFPTVIAIMIILRLWVPLGITFVAETAVSLSILTLLAKGRRLEYFTKGLLIAPLRYGVLLFDLVTMLRFAADVFLFKNRRWRK